MVRKQQVERIVDRPLHAEQFGAGAQGCRWRRSVEHLLDRPGERGMVADRHQRAEAAVVEDLAGDRSGSRC